MKKYFIVLLLTFPFGAVSYAQNINKIINAKKVEKIEKILSSDKMEGRKVFTPSIEKATDFITQNFRKAGLKYFDGLTGYRQTFSMLKAKLISATGDADNKPIEPDKIIAITTEPDLYMSQDSGYAQIVIGDTGNLFREAFSILKQNNKTIVWVNTSHAKDFNRLKGFNRQSFGSRPPVLFVLSNVVPRDFHFEIKNEITSSPLSNVVGVLPGKSEKDQYVIFSAHYDHLGIGKPDANGDSVYNGANDDASGTTAVIMLARYFSKVKDNERTLIFVTFTAEEEGGFGSQYFSRQIDPDQVVAMFNIEMIGTDSKWGNNSAYITGYDRSNFGKILQKNLEGSRFHFEPDPYPKQNLFYRSDNATLAALGVPAHTISTSKMDNEPNYHKQSDEISTLDMKNMAEIIKAIAISSKTIIDGEDTPARVEKR